MHSPYTNLKILAANNFKSFIKDFPELEDDAINAVYDLCEDSVAKVTSHLVSFTDENVTDFSGVGANRRVPRYCFGVEGAEEVGEAECGCSRAATSKWYVLAF